MSALFLIIILWADGARTSAIVQAPTALDAEAITRADIGREEFLTITIEKVTP